MQGVTELTERERCKDEWWNEVVDELRAGRLSLKNWMYLHGIRVTGCTLSRKERDSRCRVVSGPEDPRLQEEKFKEAVAIVANNDARSQINKDRARWFSKVSGSPFRWARAVDKASSQVLQAEACDQKTRKRYAPGGKKGGGHTHTHTCTPNRNRSVSRYIMNVWWASNTYSGTMHI